MTIPSADLQQYAHLLVQLGVNLQPGQSLAIHTEPIHREFALLLAEVAYDAGAKFVAIEYSDMRSCKALASVKARKRRWNTSPATSEKWRSKGGTTAGPPSV